MERSVYGQCLYLTSLFFTVLFYSRSLFYEIAHFPVTIILPAVLRSFTKTLRFFDHDEGTTLDLVRRFKGAA